MVIQPQQIGQNVARQSVRQDSTTARLLAGDAIHAAGSVAEMSSVINTTKAEARPAISVFLKRSGSFRNQVSRGDPVSRTARVRQSVGPISRRWHPSYNGPSHGWRDEACTVVVTQSAMWGGKTRSAAFGISRRREFARGPVHVMTPVRTRMGVATDSRSAQPNECACAAYDPIISTTNDSSHGYGRASGYSE